MIFADGAIRWVMTDMGYSSAHSLTLGEPLTTVDECVQDLVYQVRMASYP